MILSPTLSELELLYEKNKHFSLSDLFEQVADKYPENIAIAFNNRLLSYREVNTKANQVAYYLSHQENIKKGSVVGFYADSSDWTIISIIAIIKIGCIYLPIDSKFPVERIRYMLNDSGIKYLLIESNFTEVLHIFNCPYTVLEDLEKKIRNCPSENLSLSASSEDIAYIMYTSGTTGKPNGVMIPQSGIIRLVYSSYIPFSSKLVFLQLAPLGFDASTFEIWGALLHAAKLVIYGNHIPDFNRIHFFIRKYKISCMWFTSALFNAIIDEAPEILKGVKFLLTGGEVLSVNHIRRAQQILPDITFVNGYGPTETTTFACCYIIPNIKDINLKTIPIGKPICGTKLYILNTKMEPVKSGETGELYISGKGLAFGYLNNLDLTNERFVNIEDNDGNLTRVYKTGDLCRELPDGNLDFVGRLDFQVKINGFRIEIDEIQVCLKNYLYISDAVVGIKQKGETKKIVAYIVPRISIPGSKHKSTLEIIYLLDRKALTNYLLSWLPGYMMPNEIIELSAFPLSINGKIDRKALFLIETPVQGNLTKEVFEGVEKQLKQLCENILDIKISNPKDNFFELGAESLSMAQLLFHLSQEYNRNVTVGNFYSDPTLENLVRIINDEHTPEDRLLVDHINQSYKLFDSSKVDNLSELKNPLSLIKLKDGTGNPLFLAPGMLGNAFFFIEFAKNLHTDNPVYVFEYPARTDGSLVAESMEELATYFLTNIKQIQPSGDYKFLGFSFGGRLVFEITKQLEVRNDKISFLTIIDSEGFYKKNKFNYSKIGFELYVVLKLPLKLLPNYFFKRQLGKIFHKMKIRLIKRHERTKISYVNQNFIERDYLKLWYDHYTEYKILTDVFLIIGTRKEWDSLLYYAKRISNDLFFKSCVAGNLDIQFIDCDHMGFFKPPYLLELTDIIQERLIKTTY